MRNCLDMLPMFQEKQKKKITHFHTKGNKIHFISLGCPRNLVDSEVMLGILLKAGYEPSENLEDADYIVINTCGFLQASRQESLDAINEATSNRKEDARVIVTGCMVQIHSQEIKQLHPNIDYLLGSGDVENILKAIESSSPGAEITSAKSYLEAGEIPRKLSTPQHYAYLKIAEGCRKHCAYCIIPNIKGKLKSKPIERILKEFRLLLQGGAKEIILIAQDLGDWGKDLGYRRTNGLIHLLKTLLKEKSEFCLRLLYLYPDEIDEELIDLIKNNPRICPYLDMPIQHVNNDLLKAMRRSTTEEKILHTISTLRKKLPEITIRTSLIVGFPGESESQFKELEQFIKKTSLDNVGIFKYSQEPGSHAANLPQQISEKIKEKRYKKLMKIQKKIVEKNNKRFIGKKLQVIVEGYHPESKLLMTGRHQGQAPEIDGEIIINDGRAVQAFGQWHTVEITDSSGYDLVGRVLSV